LSLRAIDWVRQNAPRHGGAPRAALYALAWHADDSGEQAFPGQREWAAEAGLSERTLRDAIKVLEAEGSIERAGRRPGGGTIIWRVVMDETVRQISPDRRNGGSRRTAPISPVGPADPAPERSEPSIAPIRGETSDLSDLSSANPAGPSGPANPAGPTNGRHLIEEDTLPETGPPTADRLMPVWRRFLSACRGSFREPSNVDLWIEPCRLVEATPAGLVVAAPSGVHGMVSRLADQLTGIATDLAGRPMTVTVVLERQNGRAPAATRRPAADAHPKPTSGAAGTET
jgi:hypothetical protein